ncbi:MAG: ferredoxin [Acidimicrobiales bacterium]
MADERELRVKVWIDQDLCTGDGICTDHAPEVFRILEDGIAYVVENGVVLNDPGGAGSLAVVPPESEAAVIDSAGECPGECIFVEIDEVIGDELEQPSVGAAR